MVGPSLAACVTACAGLLIDEPELHADFTAVFAGPVPRWERMPDDLRLGFADIAWEHLVERGLAPPPGERRFIHRIERRCRTCGGAPPEPWYDRCEACLGEGWERVETRGERPPTTCAALALAGDSASMLEAEALAREAAARLWPWRGRRQALPRPSDPPRMIAWRIDEGDGPLLLMRGHPGVCPLLYEVMRRVAIDRQRSDISRSLGALDRCSYTYERQRQWQPAPDADRMAAPLYDALLSEDARVPIYGPSGTLPASHGPRPFRPAGNPFADFPNPFAPLCGLWDRGVAVERLEAKTIVLARKL